MRFTLFTTLVAFAVVACGGDKKSAASQAEAATLAPASVVNRVNRIADSLRDGMTRQRL